MSWFCSHPDCENEHPRDTEEPTLCEACELRDEIDRLNALLAKHGGPTTNDEEEE